MREKSSHILHSHLFRDFQKGRVETFDKIVFTYKYKVYALCVRLLDEEDRAVEATVDAFATMYKSAGELSSETRFTSWLYQIAYERCMKMLPRTTRIKLSQERIYSLVDGLRGVRTPPGLLDEIHRKIGVKDKKIKRQKKKKVRDVSSQAEPDISPVKEVEEEKGEPEEKPGKDNGKKSTSPTTQPLPPLQWMDRLLDKVTQSASRVDKWIIRSIYVAGAVVVIGFILKGISLIDVNCPGTSYRRGSLSPLPSFRERGISRPAKRPHDVDVRKDEGLDKEVKEEIERKFAGNKKAGVYHGRIKTLTGNWDKPAGLAPGEIIVLGERIDENTAKEAREEAHKKEMMERYKRYGDVRLKDKGRDTFSRLFDKSDKKSISPKRSSIIPEKDFVEPIAQSSKLKAQGMSKARPAHPSIRIRSSDKKKTKERIKGELKGINGEVISEDAGELLIRIPSVNLNSLLAGLSGIGETDLPKMIEEEVEGDYFMIRIKVEEVE